MHKIHSVDYHTERIIEQEKLARLRGTLSTVKVDTAFDPFEPPVFGEPSDESSGR